MGLVIPALEGGQDTGDGHAVLVLQAQLVQRRLDLGRRLELFIAQLGLFKDGFAQGDDLICVGIDGRTGGGFHFVDIHGDLSFLLFMHGSGLP